MFRNLIVLAMAVGAASMAGWFSINREGDQTTIQINRSEIRSDAQRAIERGREYLDERGQRVANQQPSNQLGAWNEADGNDSYNQQNYSSPNYPQETYSTPYYPPQTYPGPSNDNRQYQAPADQYDRVQYREAGYQYGTKQYPADGNR